MISLNDYDVNKPVIYTIGQYERGQVIRQPKLKDAFWDETVEERELVKEKSATTSAHSVMGSMRLELPNPTGIPVNRVYSTTKRSSISVFWDGGNQLRTEVGTQIVTSPSGVIVKKYDIPNAFAVPSNPVLTDGNSKDANCLAFDEDTGDLYEAIEWKKPIPILSWLADYGKYRVKKAAYFSEKESWSPTEWGEATAMISGYPIATMLLRPDNLTHALGLTLPPQMIYSPELGPKSVTNKASDTDGFIRDFGLPGVRMGQHFVLRPDIDMTGWGDLAIRIAIVLQTYGCFLVMSGATTTTGLKLVTQKDAFTKADKVRCKGLDTISGYDFICVGEV